MRPPQAPYPFLVVAAHLPVADAQRARCAEAERLTAALSPFVRLNHGAWIGPCSAESSLRTPSESDGMTVVPVDLGSDAAGYESLVADRLRPAYHGRNGRAQFGSSSWSAFSAATARIAEQAIELAAPGAVIVVHGFQLQLIPTMIRQRRPDVRIGFFNHIPFPATEVVAQLPRRDDLIRGMLGADVIGFQLGSDVKSFREAAYSFTGVDPSDTGTVVGAYPESIDPCALAAMAEAPRTLQGARKLRGELGAPQTLIASVDRLDCTTGLLNQLRAYEVLLETGEIDPRKTRLVQFAMSSDDVDSDRQLRDEAEQLVGRINGRFGSLHSSAVHYHCGAYSRESLAMVYAAADIFLVTPLREGMSLTAKEYVAARRHRGGVLVLSEFAGAAAELEHAIMVNPFDGDGLRKALSGALSMSDEEARRRIDAMVETVENHDAHRWGCEFLNAVVGQSVTDPQTVTRLR
ncbi:alpha,alpha-trehalose-phosphate synthase (UDP-forming) [Brevibacterium renqingii]|uniref:alpha,alpha-trehalose-phosphate synthase (UDP-forming) n=1 Tax=Brevibacterium renqingii TaxID=2776916 RepID=UPI001ADFAB82|nr:trehalose-6-phosphate synthase [Brevibacterium renqingii]